MKYFIYSIGNIVLSRVHLVLNKFSSPIKTSKIIYSEYVHRSILKSVSDKLKGKHLIQPNSMFINSFFQRINSKEKFHFNNIISKPFSKLCLSEKSFRREYKKFMEKNFEVFLQKDKKIKKIVMIDEYSVPNSALTKVAKKNRIKTFSLQHGAFFTTDEDYIKKGLDKKEHYFSYKRKNKNQVVDYVLVYSNLQKKYLLKFPTCFLEKDIKIIGCPRYDEFVNKKFDISTLKQIYGLDKSKKIILWTTQTHCSFFKENENELNCKLLFNYFYKNKDKFEFVIKLHPNEKQRNTIYDSFNEQFGNFAKIFRGKANTQELLNICNYLIVRHSSVSTEALILNKPLLILDIFKENDYLFLLDYGFNNIIYSRKSLLENLDLFETSKFKKEFAKKRTKFLKENFPFLGKSSTQAVKLISKL
jgi:hypothetical protein